MIMYTLPCYAFARLSEKPGSTAKAAKIAHHHHGVSLRFVVKLCFGLSSWLHFIFFHSRTHPKLAHGLVVQLCLYAYYGHCNITAVVHLPTKIYAYYRHYTGNNNAKVYFYFQQMLLFVAAHCLQIFLFLLR